MNTLTDRESIALHRERVVAREAGKIRIFVAGGTCGCAAGAGGVKDALYQELERRGLLAKTSLKITGCHGFCTMEPMVLIARDGCLRIMYRHVRAEDAAEIVEQSVCDTRIVERLVYTNPESGEKIPEQERVPFFRLQTRRILDWNDHIDPLEIDDYIALGGYVALANALGMPSGSVIETLSRAGLRGRGGAGFPTAVKWTLARGAVEQNAKAGVESAACYIVCNADEGDPGAYMDRSILEGNPHSVLEGMVIGAHAVAGGLACVQKGYVYVRAEYPMAIRHLSRALTQARELGLLGENILGSGLSFDIEIVKGAGAFVCGEETALLESIEDRIGEPRPKPPFPVISGLWNWPTVLNNVKTWASCRYILDKGAEEFAAVGTDGSKGTMVFALVGKVRNSGLIEVPLGITLRDIVEKIGHGVCDGGHAKAVQTGGPSGGCLPASKFDMPVDYSSLAEAGTIMGSGGMIIMDEQTCMVDTARYFLNFAVNESCGKCTPCREGVRHMHDILVEITAGRGRPEHLDMLDRMGRMIIKLSFCGLGKTAPNPVISTLRYFREEYEAHLAGKCPAKVCTALIQYTILETCKGCGVCLRKCPVGAISGSPRELHRIDPEQCTKCGICRKACKFAAIEVN